MKSNQYKILTVIIVMILTAACSNSSSNNSNSINSIEPAQSSPSTENPVQVEVQSNFLFTANEGGSISKIDISKNEVIDTIVIDGAVHNVQISPDGTVLAATVVPVMEDESEEDHSDTEEEAHGHGMVMNGTVQFFNAETLQLMKSVEIGNHPAHVVYTQDGNHVLVTNNEDNNVMVISTDVYKVIETIPTGKGPHGFRITSDDKLAYIANMGEDTVSVIDLTQMKETKRIKVGAAPVTTGVTSDGKTLAVTLNSENALAIVDLLTDQVVKVEVGEGPAQVYIQSDNQYAIVANQGTKDNPSRTVTKVDLVQKTAVATIETGDGAHGLITSADTKKLFVTNMFEDTLSVIDNETNQVVSTISTGKTPNGITITP